jgi:hypothetical protein
MLGRTRLYQRTRSPLIQGMTGARRRRYWPWVLAVVLIALVIWLYLSYMR